MADAKVEKQVNVGKYEHGAKLFRNSVVFLAVVTAILGTGAGVAGGLFQEAVPSLDFTANPKIVALTPYLTGAAVTTGILGFIAAIGWETQRRGLADAKKS